MQGKRSSQKPGEDIKNDDVDIVLVTEILYYSVFISFGLCLSFSRLTHTITNTHNLCSYEPQPMKDHANLCVYYWIRLHILPEFYPVIYLSIFLSQTFTITHTLLYILSCWTNETKLHTSTSMFTDPNISLSTHTHTLTNTLHAAHRPWAIASHACNATCDKRQSTER